MPKGIPNKTTITPPTIRERALEDVTMAGKSDGIPREDVMEPMPGVPGDVIETKADRGGTYGVKITRIKPEPFLTLRLRRVGPIITDPMRTVSIPAPALLAEGEFVTVAIYKETP